MVPLVVPFSTTVTPISGRLSFCPIIVPVMVLVFVWAMIFWVIPNENSNKPRTKTGLNFECFTVMAIRLMFDNSTDNGLLP